MGRAASIDNRGASYGGVINVSFKSLIGLTALLPLKGSNAGSGTLAERVSLKHAAKELVGGCRLADLPLL